MLGQVGIAPAASPSALAVPVAAALLVAGLLWVVGVPITRGVLAALTPWMIVGAGAHTLYAVGVYDQFAAVLFGPVGVYFTTFAAAGMVWATMGVSSSVSGGDRNDAQYLAASGTGASLVVGGVVLTQGQGASLAVVYPAFGGLLGAILVGAVAYLVLNFLYPKALVHTGVLGFLVVFGQSLDGVLTAISVDVFGTAPNYALGRSIVELARGLPTASTVGSGWLLVVVKLVFALVVVSAVGYLLGRDELRDRPEPVYGVLLVLAAYGFGPGMHHFFAVLLGI